MKHRTKDIARIIRKMAKNPVVLAWSQRALELAGNPTDPKARALALLDALRGHYAATGAMNKGDVDAAAALLREGIPAASALVLDCEPEPPPHRIFYHIVTQVHDGKRWHNIESPKPENDNKIKIILPPTSP